MRATLFLLGLFSTPALGADQFDLICSGTLTFSNAKPKVYDVRYRIDPTRMVWCSEECQEVKKIFDMQPGKIILVHETSSLRSSFEGERSIDRLTGKLTGEFSTATSSHQENAQCTRAEFSGMPDMKF